MNTNYSDAFGKFPDVSGEKYSADERFDLDGTEAVQWFEDVDHPGWKAEAAYALVELAYQNAYDTGELDDETFAMQVHNDVARPDTEFCFGSRDDVPDVDIDQYRDDLEAIDSTTKQYGFQAQLVKAFPHPEPAPTSFKDPHDYMEFADALTDQVDSEDYDVVFTAWSKGIPFLDVAADRLDLDEEQQVVMRYSPSLEDTETQTTPVMDARAAADEHTRYLFIDDVMMKGGTAENAYEWAKDHGAEQVDGFFMTIMDHTDHFDKSQWPAAADNTLFNMDAMPATQDIRAVPLDD
jgi:adenine/guanine phosphoribosyltransferase-like PRPP-binding protein